MWHLARGTSHVILASLVAMTLGCGRKGPPLAPLRLIPAAPTEPSVRRLGDEAHIRLVLPTRNMQPEGPIALDHIEIYAMTVAAGAPPPANRDLLTRKYVVGTIPVKPPPGDDEPAVPEAPADKRPSPGETVTFVERLTSDKLEPVATVAAPVKGAKGKPAEPPVAAPLPGVAPVPPAGTPAGAAAAVPPVPPLPTYPVRVYGARGVTKGGRPGQPAVRVQLPIVDVPAPPAGLKARNTETSVALEWTAGATTAATVAYNVYRPDGATPLNGQPLATAAFDSPGVEFDVEQCFAVRAVERIGGVAIESTLSESVCLTPKDTFPPAQPKGITGVASPGVVDLTWDANTEPDLAGYLVLRADASNEAAATALMQAPITDTHYLDKTATPGVQYLYFIVAVDKSTPPNRSAPARLTSTIIAK